MVMWSEADLFPEHILHNGNFNQTKLTPPVTVAEGSKACTVSAHSAAGIVGSNPTRGMDV
jgi:hypothetical protein